MRGNGRCYNDPHERTRRQQTPKPSRRQRPSHYEGLPKRGGIVDDERDVSDRPQGDPEVPALGESDDDRGGQPS
jgi:hypothetical protein